MLTETDQAVDRGEWGLSDQGRSNASRLTSRARSLAGANALAAVGAIVAVQSIFDDLGTWDYVALVCAGLVGLEIIVLLLFDYRYRASRRPMAVTWSRYREARPKGYRFFTINRRFAAGVLGLGVAAFVLLAFLPDTWLVIALAVASGVAILAAELWLVLRWLAARGEWRSRLRTD